MEISVAVNYILSHLYTKLPRRRVDSFGEELERYLHAKFQHHWFPNDPIRDAPFRCLSVAGPQVDLLFPEAAAVSGLDWNEIQACLPEGLMLSIDPGHVACQYNQPMYAPPEFNRFNSTSFLPSASLSLSSSGCSSASSSISSTNVTPNAGHVTHQVLYCVQDSWFTSNSIQGSDDKSIVAKTERETGAEVDQGDSLATAAALSVLADTEDNAAVDISRDNRDTNDYIQTKTLWNRNSLPQDIQETSAVQYNCDTGFNSLESSKVEIRNPVHDAKSSDIREWRSVEGDTDNALLTILNAEMSGTFLQNLHPSERAQLFSLLNKTSAKQYVVEALAPNNIHEDACPGGTNNCSSLLIQSVQPKYEQGMAHSNSPRFNPLLSQPLATINAHTASHFVQKSTSTPSFTAATFAQTKFGSTKLKNHSKRTPNRILSPTNIPQTFANTKVNSLLQRESIVAALVSTNQRMGCASGMEANVLGRFHLVNGQARKPMLLAEGSYPLDGGIAMNTDERPGRPPNANPCGTNLSTLSSGYNLGLPLGPVQSRCQTRSQGGALSDFLTESLTDTGVQVGGRYGFVDAFPSDNINQQVMQQPDNTTSYWCAGLNRPSVGVSGLFGDDDWLKTNLTRINEPKEPDTNKSVSLQSSFCFDNRPPAENLVVSHHDDALLSARMVNLLLEEDNSNDAADTDGQSHTMHNSGLVSQITRKHDESNHQKDLSQSNGEERPFGWTVDSSQI